MCREIRTAPEGKVTRWERSAWPIPRIAEQRRPSRVACLALGHDLRASLQCRASRLVKVLRSCLFPRGTLPEYRLPQPPLRTPAARGASTRAASDAFIWYLCRWSGQKWQTGFVLTSFQLPQCGGDGVESGIVRSIAEHLAAACAKVVLSTARRGLRRSPRQSGTRRRAARPATSSTRPNWKTGH